MTRTGWRKAWDIRAGGRREKRHLKRSHHKRQRLAARAALRHGRDVPPWRPLDGWQVV